MTRATKSLSGGGKDKFFRAVIATEPGVDPQAAARLGEALINAVAEVRVRRDAWEQYSKPAPGEKGRKGAKARAATAAAAATSAAPAASPAAAFDPFAFSAVALLTRKGKDALAAELSKISSAANLKAIATAQHLAVDPAIEDVEPLRAAIVTATERRIAERRAAAG